MKNVLKVFISWSKSPAKEIAHSIQKLLQGIFTDPNIEFFLSSSKHNGIVAGERFRNKLDNKLMESDFGILVLTNNNIDKPWMMFESGALSKNTKSSKVVPITFNRENKIIESPISNFQRIDYNENGFRELIYTINMSLFEQEELKGGQIDTLNNSLNLKWKAFAKEVDNTLLKSDKSIDNFSENVADLMMDENAYENILPKRELQLEELIGNLSSDHSKRIIIFGGISTVLRKEETIREFVSWLTVNKDSKLYICHENIDVAVKRADELSDNAFNKDVDKVTELKNRKVTEFSVMKDMFLQLAGRETQRNLYFVEISKSLTNYTTIQGSTIFLTPVLNKRASNTFTFKLKNSSLNLQIIDYIISRLNLENKESKALEKELQQIKAETKTDES